MSDRNTLPQLRALHFKAAPSMVRAVSLGWRERASLLGERARKNLLLIKEKVVTQRPNEVYRRMQDGLLFAGNGR